MECCICLEEISHRPGQCVNCKCIMHYYCAEQCLTCPICRFNSKEYGATVTVQAIFRGYLVRKEIIKYKYHKNYLKTKSI